jgi:S-(hydroxymethyl)glutathione dehydrogenase/alcohol dehydrogenase
MLNAGCLAEYAVVPAEAAVPVDDALTSQTAALIGCAAATGIGAALRTAPVTPGASVAVWGLGGVGLNVLAGARIARAGLIIGVDPDSSRRALAASRGAHLLVPPEGAVDSILAATDGTGTDFAFEVTGDVEVMRSALMSLAPGGCLALVGAAPRSAEFTFRPREFMSRQQRIVGCIYGSIRPHVDLPLLMGWCAQRMVPLDDLIGDPIELGEAPGVFAGSRHGPVRHVVVFQ